MTIFPDLCDALRLPAHRSDKMGFRPAQLSAIHAIAGHFWDKKRPALVVMPTGSGKTAVMTATAVLLRAERVLVVAPSRLLRQQLAREFTSLGDLRAFGALDVGGPSPRVNEIRSKLPTKKMWAVLRGSDVVVGTPSSLSPGVNGVFVPPTDLFDAILFDEAHHVPARTFSAIAEAFPAARQVLFTATPFRRDEREIRADLVFTYELAQARREGVFGKLHFTAVEPKANESDDEAIALAASAHLKRDRAKGFDHRIVVRASSRERADELAQLYGKRTKLTLRRLHSGLSLVAIKKAVDELRAGEIDGVVAVDMLGEGFDLPQLKVAALHAPHRSLAVTLQFIGRFARTTGPKLGPATFFALPRDLELEADRLFVPGAEWNEIVEDLSRQRLEAAQETTAAIGSFETVSSAEVQAAVTKDQARALLWALRPYFHAKVYELTDTVDLDAELGVPRGLEPVLIQRSEKERTLLWVGRTTSPLRWSTSEAWADVSYDMFLIVHVPEHRLLFICTSRRQTSVYDGLVESVTTGARRLAPDEIRRVLRGIENPEHFSVGLRNRAGAGGGGAESYRILAGRSAGNAIRTGDVGLYDQGHVFCRGTENGVDVTIGFSSASKVWTNRWEPINVLLRWIRAVAAKLVDLRDLPPQTMFDRLGRATRITTLPFEIIAGDLPPSAYERGASMIRVHDQRLWLVDFAVVVEKQSETSAEVVLRASGVDLHFTYDLAKRPHFVAKTSTASDATLTDSAGRHEEPLTSFLNESPPTFFLANLAMVQGDMMSSPPAGPGVAVGELIEAVDWNAVGVDPCLEKPAPRKKKGARKSLFEFVEDRAHAQKVEVLFADDGANEIADYVAVRSDAVRTTVQLIHCKASSKPEVPGDRVGDLYEVLGQAVKCRRWLDRRRLLKQVRHREANTASKFIVGDAARLAALLDDAARLAFEVVVVQPGLSTEPKETIADLITSVDAYQRGGDRLPLRLIGTRPPGA